MCSVAEMCPSSDVCGVDFSKVVEWRLPTLIFFLTKNRGKYRLPKYRLQDLYFTLQAADGVAVCDIIARILRQIRQLSNDESPLPCIQSTDEAVESFLSAKKRTKSHLHLQKLVAKKRVAEMDAETRAKVLCAFIDLLEEEYDIDLDVRFKDNAEETLINTGCDRHGNEYFYIIDDERLYVKDKSGRDVRLVVPPDLVQWKQFLNRYEASDDDNERQLFNMIYENILPGLQYTLTDYTQAFHRPNPEMMIASLHAAEEAELRRMSAEQAAMVKVQPPSVNAAPMSAGEPEEASPAPPVGIKVDTPGSNNPMSVNSGVPSVPPPTDNVGTPATPNANGGNGTALPPLHSNPNSVPTPLNCQPVSSPLVCGPASVPGSVNRQSSMFAGNGGPRSDPPPPCSNPQSVSNPVPPQPTVSTPSNQHQQPPPANQPPPAVPPTQPPELLPPQPRLKLVFTCSMMADAAKAKTMMGVLPDQYHSQQAIVRQFREREMSHCMFPDPLHMQAGMKGSEQLTPEQLEKRRAKMAQIYQIRERCNLAPDALQRTNCCNNMPPQPQNEEAQRAWQKLLIQHQEEKLRQQQALQYFPPAPRRMPQPGYPAQPPFPEPAPGKRPFPVNAPWRHPYDPMAGMVDLAGGAKPPPPPPNAGGGGKRRKTTKNNAPAPTVEPKASPASSQAPGDTQQYLNPYEGELTITRHVNSAYQQQPAPPQEREVEKTAPHNGAELPNGASTQNLTSASLASLARLSNQMPGTGSNPTPPPPPPPAKPPTERQPYYFPAKEEFEYRSPNGAQGNANVQVQAKAPNTIQYIPSDPPPHPAASRGPPRMPPGVYDYLPPSNGGGENTPYPPPPPPASYYPPQHQYQQWGEYMTPPPQQQQYYPPQQQQQPGQTRNSAVYGPM